MNIADKYMSACFVEVATMPSCQHDEQTNIQLQFSETENI